LFLLLLVPAAVTAKYSDDFALTVHYLFIPLRILPRKKKEKPEPEPPAKKKKPAKKPKKKAAKEPAAKKKKKKPGLFDERGLGGALSLLGRIAKLAGGAFAKVLRGVRVTRFDLYISVGGEDAAETAINYGRICAAVYPAAGLIASQTGKFRRDIIIRADFLSEKTAVYHQSRWVIIPLSVLVHAAAALIKFAILEAKDKAEI
ncbi:MAG: hypothetical protein FWE86_03985, partial [Oscillospiraceae bacterium]|nr:hypothetical protein [Oscillospiraceae bacterium]